jgi:hypothetical protein
VRTSFLGNKNYWTSVPHDPPATAIRREFAELIDQVEKVVVSDMMIVPADLAPYLLRDVWELVTWRLLEAAIDPVELHLPHRGARL